MTKYEDRGFSPVVLAPIKIKQAHISLRLTTEPTKIPLPKDDCLNIVLQSSGLGSVRFTLDGSIPTQDSGFLLVSSMPPIVLNICGNTVQLTVIGSRQQGCVLECQVGE